MSEHDRHTNEADHLVILSGGKATRLGPLTATSSKSLVMLGQRPVIVQQILNMDIRNVTIVTNNEMLNVVRRTIDRSGLARRYTIDYVVQPDRDDPVNALNQAMIKLRSETIVRVLFADTLIDPEDVPEERNWVGTGTTHQLNRHWTFMHDGTWVDDIMGHGNPKVFIGAMQIPAGLVYAADMSTYLNVISLNTHHFNSWIDTGDVNSLADATRKTFINRPQHKIIINDLGIVTKRNVSREQRTFFMDMPRGVKPLFPAFYGTNDDDIHMEYIGLPSLAELWNYWPGRADMWEAILDNIVQVMQRYMWNHGLDGRSQEWHEDVEKALVFSCSDMYINKTIIRLQYEEIENEDWQWIGEIFKRIDTQFLMRGTPGFIHGDLNFTNILYSLNTGTFRLIDPRGSFSGQTFGDLRYEFAKLWYSQWFAPISHGLFDDLGILPQREDEIAALTKVISRYANMDDIKTISALMLLSAIPLHDPSQKTILLESARKAAGL
jgi:hypothetical protein